MLCINMSFSDIEDENIFERLYYKYRNLMYTVAFDILHNTSDAEDAVSEAFLRIAKNFSLVMMIGVHYLLILKTWEKSLNRYSK